MTEQPQNKTPESTDESIRIPVNKATLSQVAPEVDSLVREYEQRYGGFRDAESSDVRKAMDGTYTPSKMKRLVAPRSVTTADNERQWAAIAHASALLTLVIGLPTAGIATVLTLFVPLMIYFYYREKSEYIAFHAAQAFALQVAGTIGWLAAIIVGTMAAVVLTVLLAITIVGVLVIPFVWIAYLLLLLASFALPISMLVFGIIGAWEAYQGKWYRIPYIGLWIERQMNAGFLHQS